MAKLVAYIIIFGLMLICVSTLFFWFMNNWLVPELLCWFSGFFLVIYSEKIAGFLKKIKFRKRDK